MTMRMAILIALVAPALAGPARADALDDGLAAYRHYEFAAAREYLLPLAAQGNARAATVVGTMYLRGQGVPLNGFLAARYYRVAAEKGEVGAQRRLGQLYLRGRGTRQDYALAIKWLSAAADQGDADAQFCLGGLFAAGEGVDRDVVAAYAWLSLAAIGGDDDQAARDRDLVAARMSPEEIARARDKAKAFTVRPEPAD